MNRRSRMLVDVMRACRWVIVLLLLVCCGRAGATSNSSDSSVARQDNTRPEQVDNVILSTSGQKGTADGILAEQSVISLTQSAAALANESLQHQTRLPSNVGKSCDRASDCSPRKRTWTSAEALACDMETHKCSPTCEKGAARAEQCEVNRICATPVSASELAVAGSTASVCRLRTPGEYLTDTNFQRVLVLVWSATALANAGGLAGGTLFVPILAIMLTYPMTRAAALSQALVCGGSLSATLYQLLRARHPVRDRPAIAFDVLALGLPGLLAGSLLGVLLSTSFATYVSGFTLCLLLVATATSSGRTAIQMRQLERSDRMLAAGKDGAALPSRGPGPSAGAIRTTDGKVLRHSDALSDRELAMYSTSFDYGAGGNGQQHNFQTSRYHGSVMKWVSLLRDIVRPDPRRTVHDVSRVYERERQRFPAVESALISVAWGLVLGFSYIRSGMPVCSRAFALAACAQLTGLYLLLRSVLRNLLSWHEHKLRLHYVFHDSDVIWGESDTNTGKGKSATQSFTALFCALSIVIGSVCAFVGIGPAALMTPVMVSVLHMDPVVVQATSAPINLITSSAVLVQLYFQAQVEVTASAILFLTAATASLSGIVLARHVVRKYRLKSLVVAVLSLVLYLSFVLCVYTTVLRFNAQPRESFYHGMC
ncbi:Sulfite exporter TauE/SafE family protein 4 [Porphyridium purpureum]|uniref:Sulfite exporter TauE/SafE family protein 4 n=1 Tax=Porphyridium purpureum TaxID=35688 RepID=A0A5J4YL46_PORPP|nr:Sulfite exporter TauE/SafE family protein 4 [Porphyridium purpureum]|eukprot:POR2929..scf249_10